MWYFIDAISLDTKFTAETFTAINLTLVFLYFFLVIPADCTLEVSKR